MNNPNLITLVIFTSEGREHLLAQTYPSFKKKCKYEFESSILAIDGKYSLDIISKFKIDIIKQIHIRKGYIQNITSILKLIETPYFFWLEDDFIFNQDVPIENMLDVMKDKSWAGIFLSRTAPLAFKDKKHKLFKDLYLPDFGFSVSPTLCNTTHVKDVFKALINHPKDKSTEFLGFEPFINDYFKENKLKYAILDPGEISHVNHIGTLESTGREYHMINAVDPNYSDINKRFLSGFGKDRKITLYNKIGMLAKLWKSIFILSIQIFTKRKAYDFAFRIFISYLRKFEY